MLKYDGKYEIFIVEFSVKDSGKWSEINFDHKWVPEKAYDKKKKDWDAFIGGKCWQQTGVHGTFDVENALAIYSQLREHNKDRLFRVVKTTIWQDSEVLWCG